MRLKDKIAVITGAGAGIGKATSLLFAREGAAVVVTDINEKTAAETAKEVIALGRRALAIRADVSSYVETRGMVEKVLAQFGTVDILVNNAGIADVKKFIEITENDWDRILSVNLKSVFNCTQAVVSGMIARRSGRIISISSVAGLTGTPTHVHYSAAKGGIVAFTKALAKEVGQYGITVNAVAPGMVETGFGGGAPESIKQLFREKTVLGRIGKPEEIAAACLYLASEDGSYITGQVLSPNGGYFI